MTATFIFAAFLYLTAPAHADDGLSNEEIQAGLQQLMPAVQECHETEIKRAKGMVQGKIKLAFVIDPEGKVKNVEAQENSFKTKDKTFQKCLVDLVQGATFPKPRGGIEVKISYPFTFKKGK